MSQEVPPRDPPDRSIRPDQDQIKRELDAVSVITGALAPFDGATRRRLLDIVDGMVPSTKPRVTRRSRAAT